MKVTFCGHSNAILSQDERERLNQVLCKIVQEHNDATFYLGGYGNFDGACFVLLKELKKQYEKIQLIFVTPYIDSSYSKLSYAVKEYDGTVYPPIEYVPKKFAIIERNKWMIMQSDVVIAYVQVSFGGASTALRFAEKKQKKIINITKKPC